MSHQLFVKRENLEDVLKQLSLESVLCIDTETTCIPWWKHPAFSAAGITPRVFAIQIATASAEFYFDFLHEFDDKAFVLFKDLLSDESKTWFIANAKFDMHHLANHDLLIGGTIHCTKAIARLANNNEQSLKLDDLGEKYLGVGKIDVISKLEERGHVTKIKKFGHNDKFEECLHFDRLEMNELFEYGCKDVRLCFDLGMLQLKMMEDLDYKVFKGLSPGKSRQVLHNEYEITKTLFEMERVGIKIDRTYTEEAYENEVREYRKIQTELDAMAGKQVDWNSAKQLKPIFEAMGEPYTYTEKGNASFDRDALEGSNSQLAKSILKYRYHYKRAHTYFENFLWLADSDDILHADAQQSGTGFARMSYWSPNLQNVPKRRDKDEAHYKVRRCFVPREGHVLADFDYSGAEYYMAMDYAKELPVIEMLKAGLDPHEKLRADMELKDRDTAKTMQFRILYGAGFEAVGVSLGYKGAEAKKIGKIKKLEYFRRLPRLSALLSEISYLAGNRGYIHNWFGRIMLYDRNTSYKAPNGLIQSGVGDMTKKAMVTIRKMPMKSRMLLQVHDAILMELRDDEHHMVPWIKEAMKDAYPAKLLPMEVDAGFSRSSWAELTDELPSVG